jgi:surface carbohydrate biosynthesis protein
MRKSVLLIIDNPHRELRGMLSVKEALIRRGISSVIVSKSCIYAAYELYRPSVVVFPRVTASMGNAVREISKQSSVCLIPSEHGNGLRVKVINNAVGNIEGVLGKNSATEVVERAFVGGENQCKWLMEAGIYDKARLTVSGTLNSDHWFLASNAHKKKQKFRVGVATTNKSLFFGIPVDSVPSIVDGHRPGSWQDSLWRMDLIAFELANLLILTEIFELLHKQKVEVSIRPHPHEYFENWNRYIKNISRENFSISRDLRLDLWMKNVSVVISSYSTTTLDAVAHGIPSISLERLIPSRFMDVLPHYKKPLLSEFCWKPADLPELMGMLEKAKEGALPISPDLERAKQFIKDNFHFPRDRPACEILAEELATIVKKREGISRRSWQTVFSGKTLAARVLSAIPFGRRLRLIISYLSSFLFTDRRENLYFPFNYSLNKDAKRFARDLFKRNISDRAPGVVEN